MHELERRTGFIFAAFLALLVVAAGRTLYLDVVRGASLRRVASEEHITDETVDAPRGAMTDRNGSELAVSEPAQELAADPHLITEPLADARKLAPLLGRSSQDILVKLSEHAGFVYLARALPQRRAEQVLALRIPGLSATPVMRRVYPRGTLAAQALGFVGTDGEGLTGLEYSQNSLLRGHPGKRRVVSDARGQPVSISEPARDRAGKSLSLTLDANVQQRAEDVLAAVGRVFAPKDATAIVMDPRSGALLAVANWPSLDANHAAASSTAALQDRAVSFTYEPGSTFKVIAIAAALQQGLIGPETTFNVPDQIQVAEKTIHDDNEHPEETLTASQILARSSNVGAIEIGKLEGAETFSRWVRRFGFGARTGVELASEEQGFTLPLEKYSGSSMGNLPIGQGELVTPMQMASAYAAIANGGVLAPAHIINAVGGHQLHAPSGRRVISARTAAQLRRMLEGVLGPEGTASQVSIPGYKLAGKTGTANKIDPATGEYSQNAYVASFIGFAPASHPRLLCAVVVDEPQTGSIYGGSVAAPAFAQIMGFALPYLGVAPE